MNIGVIGIGGVGGYFGGKLAWALTDNPEWKVYFVARNQHLVEIQNNGLTLDTDEGTFVCRPTEAMDDISALPLLDYCLVCVKSYDLDAVLDQLKGKIHQSTVILPLLNGVDISERVRSVVKIGYLHPACVYVGTHIEKAGVVKQRGGACTIFLGKDPQIPGENSSILSLFDRAGVKYVWETNPLVEIWSKFAFIASFGLVTAWSGKTIGEILRSEADLRCAKNVAQEVIDLAKASQVGLPDTILADTLTKAARFPFETKTSFQRDFENVAKPDERDLFGGSILRIGQRLGVPTTATEEIYRSLMKKKRG